MNAGAPMPLIDLSLEELRAYVGRNPCPADFNEYWSEALDELAASRQLEDVILEPVDHPAPYAECAHLWFTGVRGARLHAKYLRPVEADKPHPGVVVFHGYSGASPDWFRLLPFVGQGFSVLALDCRGQGGRSQDTGGPWGNSLSGHIVRGLDVGARELMYRQQFLDTVQAAQLLMERPEVDAGRVGVTGPSQGGGLALACAALEPRVKAAAAVYPFLCDYQRVWELDLATEAYEELRTYLRRHDPTHARIGEMWSTLGYIDVQHLAARVRADVLMLTGLMDTVCPPSTQFAAFNRIGSPKQMLIYPDFEHETLPNGDDVILDFLAQRLV
jgi:cephalosporin-C deacetylase